MAVVFGSRHQFAGAVEGEYESDEGGDQDGRDGQRWWVLRASIVGKIGGKREVALNPQVFAPPW